MPNPVYLGHSVYAFFETQFEAKPSKKTNVAAPGSNIESFGFEAESF
jgi:hypothetical protein